MRSGRDVIGQAIAGQVEPVDGGYDLRRVQSRVRVVWALLINQKLDRLGNAGRKVGVGAILKRKVFAPRLRVRVSVIVLNEAARTAHHVETHQLAPVIGVFALLKRR